MKQYLTGKELSKELMYVYSPASKAFHEFIVEEDCVRNSFNEEIKDWDYISVVTKAQYKTGITATLTCSFDSFGAPLIVFSDEIEEKENGKLFYSRHYEVVAYEDGINVWHIVPDPANVKRPIHADLIGELHFPVEAKEKLILMVTFKQGGINISMCGKELSVAYDFPETFHVGFTACEGLNRFTEFAIIQ